LGLVRISAINKNEISQKDGLLAAGGSW